jgi:hypothetical protein
MDHLVGENVAYDKSELFENLSQKEVIRVSCQEQLVNDDNENRQK